ncbi:MAG: hypothetical protein ACR2PL_01025 [Dehalococcoidia bacterium]
MKRSIDEALAALRGLIEDWAAGTARPGIRIFVYPPEWEAAMLARLPIVQQRCADAGRTIELVDAGAVFLAAIDARPGAAESLAAEEKLGADVLLGDLNLVASRALTALLESPLPPGAVCRLLVNTGSLGTFLSYSALTNSIAEVEAPAVIAFPGEGDDHSLNLLNLRADTNYRTARV